MTIERGASWGRPMAPVAEMIPVASDAELAAAAGAAHGRGEHLIALLSPAAGHGNALARRLRGDVARTIGVERLRPEAERLGYPFDLGFVSLDGGPGLPFVAHAVARRRGWRGSFAVVMNAGWVGEWYLGPRAHPNDGLLDTTVGSLPLGQRLEARRRVRTGAHLPHPCLSTTRAGSFSHHLPRSTPVYVDGCRVARARSIEAWVEPDSFTVVA